MDGLDPDSCELLEQIHQELGATPSRMMLAGRYVLEMQIGNGSGGVVYRARDIRSANQWVAIKVLRAQARARGNHEATLHVQATPAGRVPHIVSLRDVGEFEDQTFLVMDYIDGANLRSWQKLRKPSVATLLRTYLGAARGLATSHDNGVIHGDFKPENVLVANDGTPYVVDFGLATSMRDAPSHEGVGGTRRYMAPELLKNGAPTRASDQYSFCVALFEALFERHPFLPPEPNETNALPTDSREPNLRTDVRPHGRGLHLWTENPTDVVVPALTGVPSQLRTVLQRGLSADPAARNTDMSVVAAALAAAVEPVAAAEPTSSSLWRRWLIAAVALLPLLAAPAAYYRWIEPNNGGELIDHVRAVYVPARTKNLFESSDALELSHRYSSAILITKQALSLASRYGDSSSAARGYYQLARLYYLDSRNPRLAERFIELAAKQITGPTLTSIYLLGMKNAAQRLEDLKLAEGYARALETNLALFPDRGQQVLADAGKAVMAYASGNIDGAIRTSREVIKTIDSAAPSLLPPEESFIIRVNHASYLIGAGRSTDGFEEARAVLAQASEQLDPNSPRQSDRLRSEATLAAAQEDWRAAKLARQTAIDLLRAAFATSPDNTDFCSFAFEIFIDQSLEDDNNDDSPGALANANQAVSCSQNFGSDKFSQIVRAQLILARVSEDPSDYTQLHQTLVELVKKAEALPPQETLDSGTEALLRARLAVASYNLLWTRPTEVAPLSDEAIEQLATAERIAQLAHFPERRRLLSEIPWYRGLVLMKLSRWREAIVNLELSRDRWPGAPPSPALEALALANQRKDVAGSPI